MLEANGTSTFWATLALCGLCLVVNTTIALAVILKNKRSGKVFCGHCGEALSETPTSALALPHKGFLVYTCERCKNETLLPKSS